MTLHNALVAAALDWLTVWTNPQSGVHEYVSWCRPTSACESLVDRAVEDIELASVFHDDDPWLLLSLAISESRLRPSSLSTIGAFGLFQLNPRGPTGSLVRKACRRLTTRECDRLAAFQGAALFAVGRDSCRDARQAVFFHRTGRCGRGPNSDGVVRRAEAMRREFEVGRLLVWFHPDEVCNRRRSWVTI
jgi:hypothetical protein